MGAVTLALASALTIAGGFQEAPARDRLYGRVVTAAGDVYEGYLRWDRNEGSWADLLDASKELLWGNFRDAERLDEEYGRARARERSIEVLGLRISWDEDDGDYPETATSGIRFGHVRSLRVVGRDRALLTLRSGEAIELARGSSDIGGGMRGLVVEDAERGQIELRWRDLDEIEVMAPPASGHAPRAARLYGTVRTAAGHALTGHIVWDTDEILGSDVLDGEERGRDRDITFDRIAAIERVGSSASRVILVGGEGVTLGGSNDVDSRNRGIGVSDPGVGQVLVPWREFVAVAFHAPDGPAGAYDDFDGGRPLSGTVVTRDGERLTGRIRWDNDEEATWEILDGRDGGVDFDVELGLVERIERAGTRGARVTLRDGRVLELEGSNDVDEGNKGIFVTLEDGEMALVRWRDFQEVTLDGR